MKKNPTAAFFGKISLALTIVLSIVFINSCKRETPSPTEQIENKIKPQVTDCGPGYHWDFTLRQCVPNCPNGYVYCPASGTCVPNGTCGSSGSGGDIDNFKNSADFISFKNSNPVITAKTNYQAATVRMDYNTLLGENLKTIHFPVIESTGDTSGMIIGVPLTADNITNYLIFYANNLLLVRDSHGYYYGTAQADLYNTTASYTAQFNSTFELVTDTVVAGPRWINNYSCSTCKWVWPSAKCIAGAITYFFDTCNCKVLCAVSNYASTLSCTLGTFMGAAVFCAKHNNMPHT